MVVDVDKVDNSHLTRSPPSIDRAESFATETQDHVRESDSSSASDLDKHDYEKELVKLDEVNSLPHVSREVTTATNVTTWTTRSTQATPPSKPKKWYKRLNPLKRSAKPPVPKERTPSREYGASFVSLVTFQWMAPLMSLGYQRTLEENDIWLVNPDRRIELLSQKMSASFDARRKRGDRYPLVFALYETLRFEVVFGGLCSLLSSILQVMTPFVLRFLIAFANKAYIARSLQRPGPHIAQGFGLVIAMALMQVLQSLATNHFIYRGQMVGAESRALLIDAIFEKAMKISGKPLI